MKNVQTSGVFPVCTVRYMVRGTVPTTMRGMVHGMVRGMVRGNFKWSWNDTLLSERQSTFPKAVPAACGPRASARAWCAA